MDTSYKVDGLTEALRALNRVNKEAGTMARELVREGAKTIQTEAQRRARGRAGGGTYPRRMGMIGRSASTKGGAIKLAGSKYPWAWGAEYGARRAWVFGRVTTQGRLRRRQFPVWRGNQFVVRGASGPGWLIQPAIRAKLERVLTDMADGLSELISRELDRARVPR